MPDYGSLNFTIPYVTPETGVTQNYINYYDSGLYNDLNSFGESPTYPYMGYSYTGYTGTTYYAIGGSRISEKKKYGVNEYDGVTFGIDDNGSYSGYSFTYTGETMTGATLIYRDYSDGYTLITGQISGFTKEEIINYNVTRNEHFLGFVEEPRIYSDIFVERGKNSVVEMNLRLGEIDNMGELSTYGNGFFKVKKQ